MNQIMKKVDLLTHNETKTNDVNASYLSEQQVSSLCIIFNSEFEITSNLDKHEEEYVFIQFMLKTHSPHSHTN